MRSMRAASLTVLDAGAMRSMRAGASARSAFMCARRAVPAARHASTTADEASNTDSLNKYEKRPIACKPTISMAKVGTARRVREPRARATPAPRSLSLSLSLAQLQPRELYELSNEALALGARDNEAHDLHQERLIRDIMVRRARCVFLPFANRRRDATRLLLLLRARGIRAATTSSTTRRASA